MRIRVEYVLVVEFHYSETDGGGRKMLPFAISASSRHGGVGFRLTNQHGGSREGLGGSKPFQISEDSKD